MIKLYQGPPLWGLPNLSPFCIKVEAYLRMVGLRYRAIGANPRKGPKGKIPWIDDDGTIVADSSVIIDYLKRRYGDPLDSQLDAEQLANGHVVKRVLEESSYWVGIFGRWGDPASWPTMRDAMLPYLPAVVGRLLLHVIRREIVRGLYAQGYGRHTPEEIYAIGKADLDAIATLLGDKPFLLGDEPTSFDATVYAFLISLLWAPFHTPLREHGNNIPALQSYCQRFTSRFFDDEQQERNPR